MIDISLLALIELLVIWLAVEFLLANLPTKLRELAKENACRMDGSPSRRRAAKEEHARNKLRRDLWGGFLLIALATSGLLLTIHVLVVPLDLVTQAVGAASKDPSNPRIQLRAQGVDKKFVEWARDHKRLSNSQAQDYGKRLWRLFPLAYVFVFCFAVAALFWVKLTLQRALSEYADGLEYRQQQHLYLDLSRVERDAEAPFHSNAHHS